VGVLGGTFDPPHIGHLIVAHEARWQLGLDEVLLVPARHPPHKANGDIAPAERRADWLERAVADHEGLAVSRMELGRDGPSYTADTLRAIHAAEPGVSLWFILGADQLAGFPGWREPDEILALARLAVVGRGETTHDELAEMADSAAPGRCDLLDVPLIGVSSSMIRTRMALGQPIGHLVPPEVEAALRQEGLVPSHPVSSPSRKDTSRPRSS
jgi:nicotinate-nucleotide adenylyltransferase